MNLIPPYLIPFPHPPLSYKKKRIHEPLVMNCLYLLTFFQENKHPAKMYDR